MKTKNFTNFAAAVITFVVLTPLAVLKANCNCTEEQTLPKTDIQHEVIEYRLTPDVSVTSTETEHRSPELSGAEYAALLNEFYEAESEAHNADKPVRYPLSDDERDLIEHIVMSESGNTEPFEGQELIAQCILNACELDDIRPAEAAERYRYIAGNLEPNESVKSAVSAVFDDGVQVTDEPILFYYNPDLTACRWHESQEFVCEVGRHRFFKERK